MLARIRSLASILLRRRDFEHSMDEEMRFHLEAYRDDLVRSGVSREEAIRRARVEFGPRAAIEEDCREARGVRLLDELRQDLRYALRQLRRSPGFALVAIVSLTLGIGANAAIFSLMDAMFLRTLAVDRPGTLYFLAHGSGSDISTSSNYPLLARYQASGLFDQVTSSTRRTFTVTSGQGIERIDGEYVSGNYHTTLGVGFQLGRGFSTEPDRPDGRAPVAVISDRFWARRFDRRPDVIGETLTVDGSIVTVVGVTRAGFEGLTPGRRADLTLPLFVRAMDDDGFLDQRDRWISVHLVGRLRPERTEAQTRAAVNELFQRYWSEPENGQAAKSLRLGTLVVAGSGLQELRDRYGTALQLLLAMVGVVLLIACANVANMFLARGAARSREVAIRLSLGAGRTRLVRQMLAESFLISMIGAGVAVLLVTMTSDALTTAFAAGPNPLQLEIRPNWRVLGFTGVAAIACSILTGLLPALRSSRVDVTPTLKEASARPGRRRWTSGRVLVAAQLAMCFVVVTLASMLSRSVINLRNVDRGFSLDRTFLFNIDAGDPSVTAEERATFYSTLESRLLGLPNVDAVAYIQRSPLDRSEQTRPIDIPGLVIPRGLRGASANIVTPSFFRVFDVGLVRGRSLTDDDRIGTEPVAVVDETLARAYFGSSNPIGRRVFLGADREPFTIVGIVRSARFENLREDPPRTIYTALDQSRIGSREQVGDAKRITVAIRSTFEPHFFTGSVATLVAELSNRVVVSYVRTMKEQADASLLRERLLALLSAGYGVTALLLSLVGLYGITTFSVVRRTRDIGIRMALGSTRRRVVRSILRETLITTSVGAIVGSTVAIVVASLVAPFLFGISPRDPLTFAGVTLVLAATALIAGYLPGRRAASIDPVNALRTE
jgi:predicted permease